MKEPSRPWVSPTLQAVDAAALALGLVLAMLLAFAAPAPKGLAAVLGMRLELRVVLMFMLIVAAWRGVFECLGLYRSRCLGPRPLEEAAAVVLAVTIGLALMSIMALAFQFGPITARFEATFWLTACTATVGARMVLRLAFARVRKHGDNLSHLVVVGTNRRARQFARMIEQNSAFGYRLLGFVDESWRDADAVAETGHAIISDFDGFRAFLTSHVVDEVVIFTPVSLYKTASRLLAQCQEQGIKVRFATDLYSPTRGRPHVEQLGGQFVATIDQGGMRGEAAALKRVIDLLASGVALVALAPVLITIGIVVRVTSPGPAFFLQERIGLNKRRFKVIKFRTMCVDAERRMDELEKMNEASGPVFKIRKDPRITRIGAFLRKTSLDELPQLINVFVGDMSLVGPRPLPVRDYEGFSEDWHRRRFSVRPGITCLWQVGGRSGVSFERWMELDMEYIDRWSLALDLRILVKTVPAVLKGSGAY